MFLSPQLATLLMHAYDFKHHHKIGKNMKVRVNWLKNIAFEAETESGHKIIMDGSPDVGGENRGARPMETVLAGTGACSAIDVVLILKKARQAVTDCVVELTADRAETDPKVFTRIHFHYVVTGTSLDAAKVGRAIQLSAEVYCSASAMMAKTAAVTHDFEIIEEK
jgi:putative redox protein